jgi:hypothetical protein
MLPRADGMLLILLEMQETDRMDQGGAAVSRASSWSLKRLDQVDALQ